MRTYLFYRIFKYFIISKWEITSFASTMKEVLSILINEPIEKFNDREFKENYYINLKTIRITTFPPKKLIITDKKLNKLIKNDDLNSISDYYITIRQLLQIFGTEIIRTYFGDNFWVLRTLLIDNNIIISDLRFINEYTEVKNNNGIVIYIDRNQAPGLHRSESEVIELYNENKFDYIIKNTSDLKNLFNNIVQLVPKIL